jgi:predicted Rossmann fold nucleotide-binding protein DprA/Smf involved in DNA uptake
MTQRAATLRQEGCSMEAIAQRLQMPTREVEMVLAIAEMAGVARGDRGATMAFPRKPAAVLSA